MRLSSGALACVLGAAIVLDPEGHYHLPEPGSYQPDPRPVYSIGGNFGGTAVATAINGPRIVVHDLDF
jgi:hypothetical protein